MVKNGPPHPGGEEARRAGGGPHRVAQRRERPSPSTLFRVNAVDVPAPYRLSFLIGEVVRADVGVESEVRALWSHLRVAGLGDEKPGESFGRVLASVRRTMERSPGIPGDYRSLAVPVLAAVKAAHAERNVLAHDIWVQMPWRDDRAHATFARESREIDALAALVDELKRLLFRVRGLWILAHPWLLGEADVEMDARDLHSWTRVAMGHAVVGGHVVEGTPGPAVLPPGWEL